MMKWITAGNLDSWADSIQAQSIFPEIIADLIRASSSELFNFRFPGGDKGHLRGFDGELEASGKGLYIPEGKSIWEFGVSKEYLKKADSDYKKRTADTAPEVRAETTFVFASPRAWNLAKKLPTWEKEKRDLGEWKNVEYIDAVKLGHWLDQHPAVAANYARNVLKLLPSLGVLSIEEFWLNYSTRFEPPLVEEVLLAGRSVQAEDLLQKLLESSGRIRLSADSQDEVFAFAAATIRKAAPDIRRLLEARAIIVESEEAANQLAGYSGLIFLTRGQAQNIAGRLAQVGPTVISAGGNDVRSSYEKLARPTSTDLGKAFEAMGYSAQVGYQIARNCGRSIAVLARQMPGANASRPEWVDRHGDSLLPALLAGAWSISSAEDKKILQSMSGLTSYESVEAPLRPLKMLMDSPIEQVDDVWAMRAPVDAFVHLAHFLGDSHLQRFSEAAIKVFSELPQKPEPEEIYQPLKNRAASHSVWLKEGMMNTMLHMATLHRQADFLVPGDTPQNYVNKIVRGLPGLKDDHRLISSLNDQLSLLAEAAPIPFLEALEHLLEGDANRIKPIFEEGKGFLSARSSHAGMLWALETLAWEPEYLLRASICLAKLAAIDPGGSTTNRPINSLREIFLTWAPCTRANLKQRLGIIGGIVNAVPNIAWQLVSKLMPSSHDFSHPTSKPKFRESEHDAQEKITYAVVWESQEFIIDLAIELAANEPERWEYLVARLNQFPPGGFDKALQGLDYFFSSTTADNSYKVWDALRKERNRNQTFASSDWALKEDYLQKVTALVEQYKPDDILKINSWLFDDWTPDLEGKIEFNEEFMEKVELARFDALRSIKSSLGIGGLISFAKLVNFPQLMNSPLEKLDLSEGEINDLLKQLAFEEYPASILATVCVAEGVRRFGVGWISDFKGLTVSLGLSVNEIASLFMALPDNRATWSLVFSFGELVESEYWKIKRGFLIGESKEDLLFALNKYVDADRPLTAIEVAHSRLQDLDSIFILNLLDVAVLEINSSKTANATMTEYYIEKIFQELEKRHDLTAEDVAKRELSYLPFFSHRTTPLTLHKLLVSDPAMFVSVICTIYKPEGDATERASDQEIKFATAGYKLLGGLNLIPGQSGDSVDCQALLNWCVESLRLGRGENRERVTGIRIGQLLAHSPSSQLDHAWPHESVREILERLASQDIEKGIVTERYNMRGVYSKAIGEGGLQERSLAETYRNWAKFMQATPRAEGMLNRIADGWLREAGEADISAQKDALRW
ncbi:hypothetical protein [Polynucleobacter asymbioticus]|jgi:hypothetical protein|uniref:hypothetical protein n=1 Tax=Polynucleobacter asymbioticus TaxID=576611 RepID=UPI0015CFAA6E|nr:hypothetical protein [Polynucleobacter asymbioticus]